jgi:hypothetical protein
MMPHVDDRGRGKASVEKKGYHIVQVNFYRCGIMKPPEASS